MECNKDEAARAKSIAESKMAERDFTSAKKFALKAQNLFPGLYGISQMLTTLDVYISSMKMINGVVDWYGVLDVPPTADEETIKKQYKKLALALHPDKNSSAGADGAFTLISEAWGLLSDKSKRSDYNLQTGHYKLYQNVTTNPGPTTVFTTGPFPQPGLSNHTGSPFTQPAGPSTVFSTGPFARPAGPSTVFPGGPFAQPGGPSGNSMEGLFTKVTTRKPPTPKTQKSGPYNQVEKSFWTVCDNCKVKYEYRNMYRNLTLLCPSCMKPFLATEIPRPILKSKSTKPVENGNGNSSRAPPPSGKKPEARQGPVPVPAGVNSSAGPSVATKVTTSRNKNKRPMNAELNGAMNGFLKKRKLEANDDVGTSDFRFEPSALSDLKGLESRKILMLWARKQGPKMVDDLISSSNTSNANEIQKEKMYEMREGGLVLKKHKEKKKPEKSKSNGKCHKKVNVELPLPAEVNNTEVMDVPDPDFHDFDQDRSERSFAENDVWTTYDDEDGMPRHYAMIHEVISKEPFLVKFSFLNSTTTTEFSPNLEWVEYGFKKTCGDFRIGKHKTCKLVNTFSHRVKWSKGLRGAIMIFPHKGDVWALYRNWSPDWNEGTSDDVIREYDMVMVSEGYDEKKGLVSVAPLMKVAGFRTVFRLNTNEDVVSEIRREEMFRFSHRVPHHELTSNEAPGVPEGCVELDPAALPMELLRIEVGAEGGNT